MRKLTILLMLLACAIAAQAGVLKVASDGTQPYTQISSAIAASVSGDTILIMAGAYSGFTVDKKLVIIGSGTGTGVGEGVLVTSGINVLDAADSTEIRSIWARAAAAHTSDSLAAIVRIRSGAERIFLWRCFVENTHSGLYASGIWVGEGASVDIVQTTICQTGSQDPNVRWGICYRSNCHIELTSCVFHGFTNNVSSFGTTSGSTLLAKHCVLITYNYTQNTVGGAIAGVFENSAFVLRGSFSHTYSPNVTYSYCSYSEALYPPPGGTSILADSSEIETLSFETIRACDFHLPVCSVLIDAGNPTSPFDLDGSAADIGIYGGQHPYVDGGVPDYPFAVQVEVPYSAPLNGTMRIWGRGRVGPGN